MMASETVSSTLSFLREAVLEYKEVLRFTEGANGGLEAKGTKPGMQGKQKVDGFYFCSIVPKPKDVRLYFFPIYTHAEEFRLSSALQGYLKGKSCFHVKPLNEALQLEIKQMIGKGIAVYRQDELI